ncbi:MAG: FCD domain-containing protein, partial [Alphaproteobacteria bacterium]|nr:FCD domain-containing protein [Alphaproteobacteria bacterium]
LARRHERLFALHRSGDRAAYFALNQEIHDRIVELTRNAALVAIYRGFAGKIRRARAQANYDSTRWDQSVREHVAIMRAIKRRQAEILANRLRDHSAATGRAVTRQLSSSRKD